MKATIVVMCAATLIAGCASVPTAEDRARADFGPRPDNYEELIKAHLFTSLIGSSPRPQHKIAGAGAQVGTAGDAYGDWRGMPAPGRGSRAGAAAPAGSTTGARRWTTPAAGRSSCLAFIALTSS